jgi:branched-chain amino acid transport system ATP-binding protein/neutral amino acid transport system ATP-binding protein
VLSVRDLTGGYAFADEIVKAVSLNVEPGEILTIIGPNGAGKSTALKLIAGLLKTKSGEISMEGRQVAGNSPQDRARHGLIFVPQEHNVFGALSIAENLEMGAFADHSSARQRAGEIYARFPALAERKRVAASSLSGGQRQTLALAIALMATPHVLLLDEPTAALAPKAAAEIFTLIRSLADDGIAILMVEQHALEALHISTRGYVLVSGRNSREGAGPALATDPEIRRLFLGG